MAREKTVTDKKQYWKDYYASHKDRYRDWAKARRERIKQEKAGKQIERKARQEKAASEAAPEATAPVASTENLDFTSLVDEVMGTKSSS